MSSSSVLTTILLDLPWVEVLANAWKYGRKLFRGLSNEGMYEVLDYESTLELHDKKGQRATFQKRMKVRYLQDEILAFHDYAWGDGKILLDYQTNRGQAVDQYQSGYKTYILLSLRKIRNKGDVDDFYIRWRMEDAFLTPDNHWSTVVSHRMKRMRVHVIFPKSRPPLHVFLEEDNHKKTQVLGDEHRKQLADGRWCVTWETEKPRLFELYTLRWDW